MLEGFSFFTFGSVDGKLRQEGTFPRVFEVSAKIKLLGGAFAIGVVELPNVFSNFLLVDPIEEANHELPFKNMFDLVGSPFIFGRSIKLIESKYVAYRWFGVSVIFDMVGLYMRHLVSKRKMYV